MSTEAQLKALSNSELASGTQIPALKHRTVNNAIIEEMYDSQSRGDVLSGVQSALSLASGDQVLVIRSGAAFLLDATEFGFVDTLADLTDVSIPSPSNDQILAYNSGTSKWVAKDVNDLTSVVSITGAATTNQMVKFTGANSIGDSIVSDDGTTVNVGGNLSVDNNLTVGTINSGTSSDFVKGDGSLDSTDYQGQIDTEEAARISADTTLQSNIDSEESSRIAADAVLQGGIDAEGLTRQAADADLQSQIDSNDTDISNLQSSKQDTSEKGQANGYAPLDSGAKVAEAYLPDSILGQVSYQGTWDASTNTPTLANPPASTTKGEYYVTSVAGTQFSIDFQVGDWIISNGTSWEKVDNTDAVTSVFGRLGNIVANESDYASFYVDFDSDQSITGQKTFGSGDLRIVSGGSGNLPTIFINSSVGSSTESGFNSLGFNGSNDFYFTKGVGASFNGAIFSYDNAAIRTYTLQDASGTLALTSDLNTLNASNITTGTLSDSRLSSNVALKNINNNFSTNQTIVKSSSGNTGVGETFTPLTIDSNEISSYIQFLGNGSQIQGVLFGDSDANVGGITYSHSTNSISFRTSDIADRLVIDSSGNVGIGTSSPSAKLDVVGTTELNGNTQINGNLTIPEYIHHDGDNSYFGFQSNDNFWIGLAGSAFYTFSTNQFRSYAPVKFDSTLQVDGSLTANSNLAVDTDTLFVDSVNDRVGIGTSSPSAKLHVKGASNYDGIIIADNSTTTGGGIFQVRQNGATSGNLTVQGSIQGNSNTNLALAAEIGNGISFFTDGSTTEDMTITSLGNVGIGATNPSTKLDVNGSFSVETDTIYAASGNVGIGVVPTARLDVNGTSRFRNNVGINQSPGIDALGVGGNVVISGSLSKGSGSFKIDHPLPEKKDTHHLVHSFVEAPQADNIYRGKIDLADGKATVNLDEAGRMTEGTFVLLNGNIQCFTSNESGWTAIRGMVEGNTLTIEAQDAECTDTISWLVIGERIDQHMIDTEWTDENGRVITEPLKEVEPTPSEEITE